VPKASLRENQKTEIAFPLKTQTKAYFYALTAILFWSTMGTAFKLTLGFMDPPVLLFTKLNYCPPVSRDNTYCKW